MKRHNLPLFSLFVALFTVGFTVMASANSSWRWLSDTRPYDVFPIVALITIIIETIAINYLPKINRLSVVTALVVLGNLLSFAAPYLVDAFTCHVEQIYTFAEYFEHWPAYIVRIAYFVATLAIELPIIFFTLKKSCNNKKGLFFTIVGANAVTTLITAGAERLFCPGQW